jgi:uncharacterized RDD family membrane protein YckC
MTFDDTKTVTTPEQVAVTYTLAGIGTRFAAMLLDTCIQGLAAVIVFVIAGALTTIPFERLGALDTMTPSWLLALTIIVVFGVIWGYFIFWETIWNGQTPGKRAAGIRVMRDGGYPVDFRAAFVRNIVRYVDFLPLFYGTGALAVFLSKDSKRLGDYAAGTIVVMDSRPAPFVQSTAAPPPPEYRLLGDPAMLNLRAMTREQFAVVDRFLSRRLDLSPNVRVEMAYKIAWPLMALIGTELPTDASYPYEAFLVELAAAYRSRGAG